MEVDKKMAKLRKKTSRSFVPSIPNSVKTVACDMVPRALAASAALLTNTTAIVRPLRRLIVQFNALYSRKAFVHWYTAQGLDEVEFPDAEADVMDLVDEYQFRQDVARDEDTVM